MELVPLTIKQTVAVVHLSQGMHCIIDADAWPVVGRHIWTAHRSGGRCFYATSSTLGRLHNLILPPGRGRVIDHKNRNSLDNRRANLRAATTQQNCANAVKKNRSNTGYRGAYWDIFKKKFVAKIGREGKLRNIGQYETAIEAAKAYDAAAIEEYGEFAIVNFPKGESINAA